MLLRLKPRASLGARRTRPPDECVEVGFSEVRRSKLNRSGRGLGTWTGEGRAVSPILLGAAFALCPQVVRGSPGARPATPPPSRGLRQKSLPEALYAAGALLRRRAPAIPGGLR
jgi:hypothetical protein